ncbi:unnamed protein product [Parajaminaea phylloscopi]
MFPTSTLLVTMTLLLLRPCPLSTLVTLALVLMVTYAEPVSAIWYQVRGAMPPDPGAGTWTAFTSGQRPPPSVHEQPESGGCFYTQSLNPLNQAKFDIPRTARRQWERTTSKTVDRDAQASDKAWRQPLGDRTNGQSSGSGQSGKSGGHGGGHRRATKRPKLSTPLASLGADHRDDEDEDDEDEDDEDEGRDHGDKDKTGDKAKRKGRGLSQRKDTDGLDAFEDGDDGDDDGERLQLDLPNEGRLLRSSLMSKEGTPRSQYSRIFAPLLGDLTPPKLCRRGQPTVKDTPLRDRMAAYMRASVGHLSGWTGFLDRLDGNLATIRRHQTELADALVDQLSVSTAPLARESWWRRFSRLALSDSKDGGKFAGHAGVYVGVGFKDEKLTMVYVGRTFLPLEVRVGQHVGWAESPFKASRTSCWHYRLAKGCDRVVYLPLVAFSDRASSACREGTTVAEWYFSDLLGTFAMDASILARRREFGLPCLDDKAQGANSKSCMERYKGGEQGDDGARYSAERVPYLLDATYRHLYAKFISLYIQHSVAVLLCSSEQAPHASNLSKQIEAVRDDMRGRVKELLVDGKYSFGWRVGSDGAKAKALGHRLPHLLLGRLLARVDDKDRATTTFRLRLSVGSGPRAAVCASDPLDRIRFAGLRLEVAVVGLSRWMLWRSTRSGKAPMPATWLKTAELLWSCLPAEDRDERRQDVARVEAEVRARRAALRYDTLSAYERNAFDGTVAMSSRALNLWGPSAVRSPLTQNRTTIATVVKRLGYGDTDDEMPLASIFVRFEVGRPSSFSGSALAGHKVSPLPDGADSWRLLLSKADGSGYVEFAEAAGTPICWGPEPLRKLVPVFKAIKRSMPQLSPLTPVPAPAPVTVPSSPHSSVTNSRASSPPPTSSVILPFDLSRIDESHELTVTRAIACSFTGGKGQKSCPRFRTDLRTSRGVMCAIYLGSDHMEEPFGTQFWRIAGERSYTLKTTGYGCRSVDQLRIFIGTPDWARWTEVVRDDTRRRTWNHLLTTRRQDLELAKYLCGIAYLVVTVGMPCPRVDDRPL